MCGIVGQINERGFSASFEEDALASLRHRARMRKVPGNLTASGGGAATATQQVDVTAILDGLAAKNREKLDWRHSIVDLMKLVGMDSSLNARFALGAVNGAQVDVLKICPARIELADVLSGADPLAIDVRIVHRSPECRYELLSRHGTCSPREVRVSKTKAAAGLISHYEGRNGHRK